LRCLFVVLKHYNNFLCQNNGSLNNGIHECAACYGLCGRIYMGKWPKCSPKHKIVRATQIKYCLDYLFLIC
jgi:hypothetical protein